MALGDAVHVGVGAGGCLAFIVGDYYGVAFCQEGFEEQLFIVADGVGDVPGGGTIVADALGSWGEAMMGRWPLPFQARLGSITMPLTAMFFAGAVFG